jgi:hypothetical protein
MAAICCGLGCMILCDKNAPASAGNFQTADDVPDLPFALAHSFDTIAAMSHVGGEARYELNERRMKEAARKK